MGSEPPAAPSYSGRPTSKCRELESGSWKHFQMFLASERAFREPGNAAGVGRGPPTQWALLSSGMSATQPQECPRSSTENRPTGVRAAGSCPHQVPPPGDTGAHPWPTGRASPGPQVLPRDLTLSVGETSSTPKLILCACSHMHGHVCALCMDTCVHSACMCTAHILTCVHTQPLHTQRQHPRAGQPGSAPGSPFLLVQPHLGGGVWP